MEHFQQRAGRSFFVGVAAAVIMTACSKGEEARSPAQPLLKYALAAGGLPQSGIWKSTPAFADINGDGLLDLAALPRLGDGAHVWSGDGKGTWTEASEGLKRDFSCGGGVAFGDVNQDGSLDLAVADHCKGVFVYVGDGQGHWKASTEGLNPAIAQEESLAEDEDNDFVGAEDLALGDMNEDGFLDLVVTSAREGGLVVYWGDGSGQSWKEAANPDGLPSADDPEPGHSDSERGGWANRLLLHDVDGDGHLDIVASYYAGPRVWRGNGKGQWQSYAEGLPSLIPGGSLWGIAVGDINEDGRVDLAVADVVNGPEVFLQSQDGSWRQTPDVLPALLGGAYSVALGDLDGDGHLDLVIGGIRSKKIEEGYGLFILRGDGKGGWMEVQETELPSMGLAFTWGSALVDVNGDKRLDLAVATGGMAREEEKPQADKNALPVLQVWLNRS
jgi:hypothetical protein